VLTAGPQNASRGRQFSKANSLVWTQRRLCFAGGQLEAQRPVALAAIQ
jgi:hypothetical protein